MWTIGYDQVLDKPATSPSTLTLSENPSRVPSISQPMSINLPSSGGHQSADSDAESEDGDGKSSEASARTRPPLNKDRSFDEDADSNGNKDALVVPALNSPTGSDKFIVVTDIEILEAKGGSSNENQMKSSYLDLKEGESTGDEETSSSVSS